MTEAVTLYLATLIGAIGWWGALGVVIPLAAFGVLIPIACIVGFVFGIAGIAQWFLDPRPRASRDCDGGRTGQGEPSKEKPHEQNSQSAP